MKISYNEHTGRFLISCKIDENHIILAMPDRRFNKGSGNWIAPALRRNAEYLSAYVPNKDVYTPRAWEILQSKLAVKSDISGFPPWFKFKNKPMKHQSKALDKFYPLDECAIFFEQGLGKTYTSINLACAWRMNNEIDCVLVLCPSSIKLVWENELTEHSPLPLSKHVLESGKYKQYEKFFDSNSEFKWLIVGIEALSAGNAYSYVEKFVTCQRTLIIVDESSRIKTNGATRTDKTISLGRRSSKRIILSGTSITQGIEDLFTQYKFLSPDILGFDSYYSFRANYCETISIPTGVNTSFTKIVGYKNEEELIKSISPYTLRVEKKDAIELPEKVFLPRYIKMNLKQMKLYNDMFHEFMIELQDESYEVSTVLERMLRLQQITGGHYPSDNGEDIILKPIPGPNPKLEELMALLDDTPGKMIVWCQFRSEIKLVAEAIEKANISYVEFHGGCSSDQKSQAVSSFMSNSGARVFLATKAAAYGLTLVSASNACYFSQGYSLEEYSQSQDRIHRIGQKTACTYFQLMCQGTVDTDIFKALNAKQNLASMVYSMIRNKQ